MNEYEMSDYLEIAYKIKLSSKNIFLNIYILNSSIDFNSFYRHFEFLL